MKLDSLSIHALVHELTYLTEGTRIEKIHQPTKFEVVMNIRTSQGNQKLLFSVHPETFRFHLTTKSYENPMQPKAFCVVMRKYLEGGKITGIEQIACDRIVKMTIEAYDAVGDLTTYFLYLELMGKHSNLILVDHNDIILDAIKKIDIHKSEYREVLPKLPYVLPQASKQLDEAFPYYISPLIQKWLTFHDYAPEVLLLHAQTPKGYVYHEIQTQKMHVCFFKIDELFTEEDVRTIVFKTFSEALDMYFYQVTIKQQLMEKTASLLQFVHQYMQRNTKKIKKLQRDLQQAEDYEQYQKIGNLLLAQQQTAIIEGDECTVVDYYDEQQASLVVRINPLLSLPDNAQKYFKKYTKSKKAIEMVTQQIATTQTEIAYFSTISQSLDFADLAQAEEIREELVSQGYLKRRIKNSKKTPKKNIPQYSTFTYDGVKILVGRNNLQNDYITFKQRRKNYTWLHVKDFPGSHVLICSTEYTNDLLEVGALLAAFYSKMRLSENVAVDYTAVQHVSKPSGAKPGFVIYKQQQTLHVTPAIDKMMELFPEI